MLVNIIKHVETGHKYVIPAGDSLPSNAYIIIRREITEQEAQKIVPPKLNPKRKC